MSTDIDFQAKEPKLNPNHLTGTQWLYHKIFKELPKRDMEDCDMPALEQVLATLTPREEKVVRMRFGLGYDRMTQAKIGREFAITGSAIQGIENKAIRKLRHESRAKHIKSLFSTYTELRTQIEERDNLVAELQNQLKLISEENIQLRRRMAEIDEAAGASADIPILDLSITEMDLSVRSFNALKRAGLGTVRSVVVRYNKNGLRGLRNFGRRSCAEVLAKLVELGIPLNQPEEYYRK